MTTELRDFGDGRTVVVYTTDNQMATKLRSYVDCFKVVDYEQEQKKGIRVVAKDFYFPRRKKRKLLGLEGVTHEGN